jgi:hypothetical protein
VSAILNTNRLILVPAQSGRVQASHFGATAGVFRLPTDPLFYADLTLLNIVVGSRYRITRNDTSAELATGVASSTAETAFGLACYANPMRVDITVRNASGSTKYRVFDTSAFMVKAGTSAYILQQPD